MILNRKKSKSRTLITVTELHSSLRLRIAADEKYISKRCTENRRYALRGWRCVTFQGHRDKRTYRPPKPFMRLFSSRIPNGFEGSVKNQKSEGSKAQTSEGGGDTANHPRVVKL